MSQENVEIVRRTMDAFERGDIASAESMVDEDVEWDVHRLLGPELGFEQTYRGHEGVRAFFREWLTAWERVEFSFDEFIDAGEKVLVVLRQRARGQSSGIEISHDPYVSAYTVSEGKIIRMEFFPSRKEALEAAGLSE